MCVSPQRRAIFRHQNCKKCSEKDSFLTFWLLNVLLATAACNFSTSKLQKVLRDRQFFSTFTSKCAFRHSGVQFLIFATAFRHIGVELWNIRTSKSAPKTTVFEHFHLQMCFSPQRRAIFQHLNRQKCSKPVMFCTFWLANVRFARAPGNFSTVERQKVLRRLQFFNILTFKCAFRHSARQFFDSRTSKSAPKTTVF